MRTLQSQFFQAFMGGFVVAAAAMLALVPGMV